MPLGIFRDIPTFLSLDEIAEYLGSPPMAARSHPELVEMYSRYFNRPTGERRGSRRKLVLRDGPISALAAVDARYETSPLCSGVLDLDMAGVGRGRFATANYHANVNPTRFVRYQDCNVQRLNYQPSGPPPLFRYELPSTGEEYSLDGSNNWLPDRSSAIWQSFIGDWPSRLSDYFNNLETAMRGEMSRRGELSSIDNTYTLSFEPSTERWHLWRIETYWEFLQEASPELVALLDRAMASFNALPYSQNFTRRPRSRGREPIRTRGRESVNGMTISVTANPGTKLTFYAKTNKRIRFEVRHEVRDLASRSPLPSEVDGVQGMVSALLAYSADAAETLNVFLEHLERVAGPGFVSYSPSPVDLLFDLVCQCDDREAAKTIAGLLLTQGAVSRIERLNSSLDRLSRARIVERVKNRQKQQSVTYILTPKYHHALAELRKITTETGLIIPRRLRNPH